MKSKGILFISFFFIISDLYANDSLRVEELIMKAWETFPSKHNNLQIPIGYLQEALKYDSLNCTVLSHLANYAYFDNKYSDIFFESIGKLKECCKDSSSISTYHLLTAAVLLRDGLIDSAITEFELARNSGNEDLIDMNITNIILFDVYDDNSNIPIKIIQYMNNLTSLDDYCGQYRRDAKLYWKEEKYFKSIGKYLYYLGGAVKYKYLKFKDNRMFKKKGRKNKL